MQEVIRARTVDESPYMWEKVGSILTEEFIRIANVVRIRCRGLVEVVNMELANKALKIGVFKVPRENLCRE